MTLRSVSPAAPLPRAGGWEPSPEFQLLRCCGRRHLTPAAQTSLPELTRHLDWERLLALALDQGMLPLLWHHLSQAGLELVPAAARSRFAEASRAAAAQAMLLAANLPRVLRWLQNAGITAVPFKGPALAHLLYGDVTLRQMFDLDLLVARQDLPRAQRMLVENGFSPTFAVPPAAQQEMLRNECESSFDSADGSYAVELHWQIAPRFYGIDLPSEELMAHSRPMQFEQQQILSLAPEDHLCVLSVHAAKHVYRKLAWIADIAECLRCYPGLDWDLLLARSRRARAQRVVAVGLELAATLLDAPLPVALRRDLASNRCVSLAVAGVQRDFMPDPESEFGLARHFFQWRLCQDWRQRLQYAFGLFLNPTMADRTRRTRFGRASRLAHSLGRILQRGYMAAARKAGSAVKS